ncbi:MAG: hypothetical protein ACP5N0_09610 [Methanosarcina sp.]
MKKMKKMKYGQIRGGKTKKDFRKMKTKKRENKNPTIRISFEQINKT